MSAQKIARQGLTWRHVGVVITMCLTLFTAVAIVLYLNTSAYKHLRYRSTLPSYT